MIRKSIQKLTGRKGLRRAGAALLFLGAGWLLIRTGAHPPPPLIATPTTHAGPHRSPILPDPPRASRATPEAEAKLARSIRRLVEGTSLGGGRVSVSVRACDDGAGPGREIVALDSMRPLKPASNMKVISTGAALHQLGPDFEFETRVVGKNGVYVLVGDGDPALGDPQFFDLLRYRDENGEQRSLDEEKLLDFWADAIVRVHGGSDGDSIRILVDDSIFEADGWHPGWNPDDRLSGFAAEVAGINFHRNTWHFRPDPSSNGRPDWGDIRPEAPWLLDRSTNRSTSAGSGKNSTAWIQRSPQANDWTFKGAVAGPYRPSNPPLELTMHDPSMIVAELLADRIRRRGVEVDGVGRHEEGSLEGWPTIGPRIKSPIDRLVEHCNEESQNLYAESLLKRAIHDRNGRTASWGDANAVIRAIARERLGDSAEKLLVGIDIDDGSGLSHGNRVNASFVTAWLDAMQADRGFGDLFVQSLSEGGVADDGTLGKRFKDFVDGYRVEAKSGYIFGVSALSGFVTAPDGRRWSFSVLCNGVGGHVRDAKTMQERIARRIAEHGQSS